MQKLRTTVEHPLGRGDATIVESMRAATAFQKGVVRGKEVRGQYDALMESVQRSDGVAFEDDTLNRVPGIWVYPVNARPDEAIVHLHGGWFTLGTAKAYRHFVGQIAARAGVKAFIPDYRLAPENPFPAAVEDVMAVYRALDARGIRRVAITGDSAGGNLALVLSLGVARGDVSSKATHVGTAVLSPITDLSLAGASYETRAEVDPLFTRSQVAELVNGYLGEADPKNPRASPLYAKWDGLAPLRIHVGDSEVLLDDSRRLVERAVAAGVDAALDIWMGMPHGFASNVRSLKAAAQALDAIGTFLMEKLGAAAAKDA
jgi:monoterpene epsilon-lactone hydrolase